MDALRSAKLLSNKHIPTEYLQGPISARRDLLAGLMDTDGHARKNGSCVFINTNRRLAHDVKELAGSLGIRASLVEGRATLSGRDMGPVFRVSFSASFPVFKVRRKLERQRLDITSAGWRYIKSVEPVASVPTKCIRVASPDGLFLATRDYVVTHNSGKRGSTFTRRGFTELPFEGVRKAQPTWWAQAQAEMEASGAREVIVVAVAKDVVRAFKDDQYMQESGSLVFYTEAIEHDEHFCQTELRPTWGSVWDAVTGGHASPAWYLRGDTSRYVRLPKPADTGAGWGGVNQQAVGTFNPCGAPCELADACKRELARSYAGRAA
jgi:hypothetical protein